MPKKNQRVRRDEKKKNERLASEIQWTCLGLHFNGKYPVAKLGELLAGKTGTQFFSLISDPRKYRAWSYPLLEQLLRDVPVEYPELGELMDDWLCAFKELVGSRDMGKLESVPLSSWLIHVYWIPRGGCKTRKWTLFDVERLFSEGIFDVGSFQWKVCFTMKLLSCIPIDYNDRALFFLFQPVYLSYEAWFFLRRAVLDGTFKGYPLHDAFFRDYIQEFLDEVNNLRTNGSYHAKSLLDSPEGKILLQKDSVRKFTDDFTTFFNACVALEEDPDPCPIFPRSSLERIEELDPLGVGNVDELDPLGMGSVGELDLSNAGIVDDHDPLGSIALELLSINKSDALEMGMVCDMGYLGDEVVNLRQDRGALEGDCDDILTEGDIDVGTLLGRMFGDNIFS
jgi:hypothetical protein